MLEFSGWTTFLLVAIILNPSIRILREYQCRVVFMLGRFWKVKGTRTHYHHSDHPTNGMRRPAHSSF